MREAIQTSRRAVEWRTLTQMRHQSALLSNEARFQPYQSARLRRMILPMSEGLKCGGGNFSECSEARQQRGRLRQGRNNRAGYDELAC